jgi:hypothetical protein
VIALAAFAAVSFAQAAAAPAIPAVASGPLEVPVLDKEKGARALEAYRKFRRQLCADLLKHGGERAEARLKAVGLEDVEVDAFCTVKKPGTAIASGALLGNGVDEVLLSVETFRMAQTGSSLAVMRDAGEGYRFVKHLGDAAIFEARMRLAVSGQPDSLFLCESRGLGGVYPGTCGLFGRGAFGEQNTPGNDKDDLGLIELTEYPCSPYELVSAGKIVVHGDRLTVPLILETGTYVAAPGDTDGDCKKRKKKTRRSFDIEYKFDGQTFRRVTPTPKAAQAVLDKQ